MFRFALFMAFAPAVALSGCRATRVDLACDVLVFDAASPERSVVVAREATQIDPALLADGAGVLTIRTRWLPDSGFVDGALVRATRQDRDTTLVVNEAHEATFRAPAGSYTLRPRCIGCARARAVHSLVAGEHDTLDFLVSRARSQCAAPAT